MLHSLRALLVATACAAALAACQSQPFPGQDPTPPSSPAAPPPPGGAVLEETVVEETVIETESPGGAEETIVVEEETGLAVETPEPDVRREQAVQDCYAYATSQVARDYQVQGDAGTVIDPAYQGQSVTGFMSQMNDYGNERRRQTLFNSCMSARGYPQ